MTVEAKALVDLTSEQTSAVGTDLLFVESAGTPSKITKANMLGTNLVSWSAIDPADATITITGGTISGITDLAVADGGTGAGTAAGARTSLGTPPLPQNATGSGQFVELFQVANTILYLPAGGTWAYFAFFQDNTTGTVTSGGLVAGVEAGGTNIGGPVVNANSYGFAWRIDNA